MITKITTSIKNYPVGAAIGAVTGFLLAKKFAKQGIIVSSLSAVFLAIIGSGAQAKFFPKSGSNKITVTGAPVETGTTNKNKSV
jgi:hypothetical protein